jgi:hypothetical protein
MKKKFLKIFTQKMQNSTTLIVIILVFYQFDPNNGQKCVLEYDTDYAGSPIGNDLENVPSSSPLNCCSQCASHPLQYCAAWTYSGGTCYFKSSSGVKVFALGSKSLYNLQE